VRGFPPPHFLLPRVVNDPERRQHRLSALVLDDSAKDASMEDIGSDSSRKLDKITVDFAGRRAKIVSLRCEKP
jgi:hypothetical protein